MRNESNNWRLEPEKIPRTPANRRHRTVLSKNRIRRTKRGKRKRGAQKGHKGYQQQMLEPTDTLIDRKQNENEG